MDPVSLAKVMIKGLPDLKDGGKWKASHHIEGAPTAQRPKVKEFGCGLKDGEVWFRFLMDESGQNVDLRGTYSFKSINERITVNQKEVDADDIVLGHRFKLAKLIGVVEFEYELDDKTHKYRFDATLYSPL